MFSNYLNGIVPQWDELSFDVHTLMIQNGMTYHNNYTGIRRKCHYEYMNVPVRKTKTIRSFVKKKKKVGIKMVELPLI